MEGKRILIISTYTLFVEAIEHILQGEGIEVVATAPDLETGLPLVQTYHPDTIIVDSDVSGPASSSVVAMLTDDEEDRQVVFFTLANNHMVIHQRRHVIDTTPADLISILSHT